ncbi:MAG: M81 family metallopeptidase [Caldilineaceae bacterium]
MKLFIATLGTETNTFSPFITSAQTFEETYLTRGGGHGEQPNTFAVPLAIWRQRAEALGWEVVESLCAFAMPSGVTLRALYRQYKEEILADLRAAMPVDAVLLNIHGAMVVEGFDLPIEQTDGIDCADAEGDLFEAVRAVIGPEIPFGAELDLHCHLTEKKVRNTDALVLYKEYPHTDFPERAEDLFEIIKAAAEGKVRPVQSLHDCGAVGVFHTTREPMRSFVDHMSALEGKDGVLSVSLGHCFPWADVPELGVRSLVVTDNRQAKGDEIAADLCRRLNEIYDAAQPPLLEAGRGAGSGVGAGRRTRPRTDCPRGRGRQRRRRRVLTIPLSCCSRGWNAASATLPCQLLGSDCGAACHRRRRRRHHRSASGRQNGADVG